MSSVHEPDVPNAVGSNPTRWFPVTNSLDASASQLPGAAYILEMDGLGAINFPYVSTACADIYGLTATDAMADAHLMHNAIHPDDKNAFERAGQRSAVQMAPLHWEGRILRPDGETRSIVISSRPQRRKLGGLRWHGVVIDRTDAYNRDTARYAELMQREQRKGDLLNVLSHDIGTPLASILGNAEQALSILDMGNGNPAPTPEEVASNQADLRGSLSRIIRNAHRLDFLRQDLLAAGAVESGHLTVDPRSVLVRARLAVAAESVMQGPVVRIFCPSRQRCFVQPGHLDQILINLMSNAARFARQRVTVRVRSEQDTVEITVSDDGPGVPETFAARLFMRYARGDAPQGDGSGLGLFVVHTLATANRGSVRYQEVPQGGASFTVTLPRRHP